MKRTVAYEDIKPLIELCKVGKLFDVQAWIAAGKPVNPPPPPAKGRRPRTPLQYAIKNGFHSLVKVLLEGGAEIEGTWNYSSLDHALQDRRYEIAKLLVERGADPKSVDMMSVFQTWQPDMMIYFIDHGADVETGNPLAQAFCSRIQTALRIYKQYKDRFPSFQEQVNIALRHHCREGNLKWISLMLWAGADPYAKGPDDPESQPDPECDQNAIEKAVIWGHHDVFKLRQLRLDPEHKNASEILSTACYGHSFDLLRLLLDLKFPVNDQSNGGSSHIETVLKSMSWGTWGQKRTRIDSEKSREKMRMLHCLVRHGARWIPDDASDIKGVRRALLNMTADYTAELVWLMSRYGACERAVVEQLLKSSAMRGLVILHSDRIAQFLERLP